MPNSEPPVAPAKTMQRVIDQYKVIAHLARSIAVVHEQMMEFYAAREQNETTIDYLGDRSASIMETLGDILNGMDAVDDDEDAWTAPIFEVAQATWPQDQTEGA